MGVKDVKLLHLSFNMRQRRAIYQDSMQLSHKMVFGIVPVASFVEYLRLREHNFFFLGKKKK